MNCQIADVVQNSVDYVLEQVRTVILAVARTS